MKFSELLLNPQSLTALAKLGISACTAVQAAAIPAMKDWRDVLAKAPTGTGKTFAFGLPILEHLGPEDEAIKALILAPTRELAQQIGQELDSLLGERPELRSLVLYGGQSMQTQLRALREKPQIIVATPGRLLDHLQHRHLRLDEVETVVLDEADRMLDMGFIKDVRRILDRLRHVRQLALFSATLSRSVMDISYLYQRDVIEISVEAEAENRPQIDSYEIRANGPERCYAIRDILRQDEIQQALVFVNMKQSADVVAKRLQGLGIRAVAIQGDMAQAARNRVMKQFRSGAERVLVATDVAARGLDIESVDVVFNYDLPLENENYIHRIGRTGRAGRKGLAFSFVNNNQIKRFQELLRKCHQTADLYPWENSDVLEDNAASASQTALSPEAEAEAIARIKAEAQKKANGNRRPARPRSGAAGKRKGPRR